MHMYPGPNKSLPDAESAKSLLSYLRVDNMEVSVDLFIENMIRNEISVRSFLQKNMINTKRLES